MRSPLQLRIEEFADKLKETAVKYNFKFLEEYADKLIKEPVIVDLDSIKETLNYIPRIIYKIC